MKQIVNVLFQDSFLGARGSVISPDELDPDKHRLLVFHGGEDIHPELYGEINTHSHVYGSSRRDSLEVPIAKRAFELGIPILGICRGAQLMCALGGGKLWQHVDNHAGGNHSILFNGEETWSNSCHHQMMRATDEMELLAVAPQRSPLKYNQDGEFEDPVEIEILHIPKLKALCVQGHPEWLNKRDPLVRITEQLLETYNYI